jgi:hypothetical protein
MRKTKTKAEKRKAIKRKAERLYSNIYVHYKKIGKKTPWKSVAHNDISGVGIGLHVNEPLKVMERISISFYLKNDPNPCNTVAKVIWCHKLKQGVYQAGLEFEKVQSDARLIEMLCEKIVDLSLERRKH